MRNSILIIPALVLFLLSKGPSMCQKQLLLEKIGRFRHFSYNVNDQIKLRTFDSKKILKGTLSSIADSFLIINNEREVTYDNIDVVLRPRHGFLFLKQIFLKAGIPFFLIVGINRTINHEYPIFDELAINVGGGLTMAGILITPLTHKRMHPGKSGWQLKVLDFDTFR